MRRILLALFALPQVAHADDANDVFGLHPKTQQQPLDCSDGLTFGCTQATDPFAESVPYALSTWLPAPYLLHLPVADATQADVAHFALGAARDEAGPSFGGANGLENIWTVEGAPTESVRTGAAETRIPLAFLDGIYVTAGGFAARDRTSTGGTIDARLRRGTPDHEIDARAFVSWFTESRHPPILPATYAVRRGLADAGPDLSAPVVATGPISPIHGAWYAAGIAPELGAIDFTWRTGRLVDRDNDGVPDGLPGVVNLEGGETTKLRRWTYRVPAMARVGIDRGVHHADVTLLGTAARDTFYLFNSTQQAAGTDTSTLIGDAIATWRGTWHDTHAHAQFAWHRASRRVHAADDAAANIPQRLWAFVPETLDDDPALAALCSDGAQDPYPMIPNCPVPTGWFTSGGAGTLVDTTGDRPSITADIAHRIGRHVLRAGGTGEDARLVTTTRFTGGSQIRSLFEGYQSVRTFISNDGTCGPDPGDPCDYADHSTLTSRTRYTAAYVEDTWAAAPNISVDYGLRWELMWVGPVLHFSNELAPRLGMTWDPLGNGTSRVWTSMGRSFALLPAGLGSTLLPGVRTVDDITTPFGPGRSLELGTPIRVVDGVQPITQDQVTLGGDVALARAVRATTWVQGVLLRRGLDTTRDGFDNPGRNGDPAATRETVLFAAQIETAPTAKLALRAGYLHGRTVGTWTGAFDPREGAVLYAGTAYDFDATNLLGHLPSEPGRRFFVEAERRGHIHDIPVYVSTRLTVASGRPRNVIANGELGPVFLLPRGSAGNGPLLTQANVRLAGTWRRFEFTLDLFNVFNRREATNIDELYAGSVAPIDGGDRSDLPFLKTVLGNNAVRRSGFAVPVAYQAPFAVSLGIHRAF